MHTSKRRLPEQIYCHAKPRQEPRPGRGADPARKGRREKTGESGPDDDDPRLHARHRQTAGRKKHGGPDLIFFRLWLVGIYPVLEDSDGVGFEPTVGLPLLLISSQVH